MLVMTTIFTSKIAELPPTSDTKMIDIWLIFCLLIPFSFALIQTAMECYREEETETEKAEAWAVPLESSQEVCFYLFSGPAWWLNFYEDKFTHSCSHKYTQY